MAMTIYIGDRVIVHSLRTNAELNRKFGIIAAEEHEKVVVNMDGGRTVRLKKEKVTKVMHWGDSDPAGFFKNWENEIAKMDPTWHTIIQDRRGGADLVDHVFPNNVYRYLFAKIMNVVNTKKKIGEIAWAFAQAEPSDYVCGLVWADGTPEQSSPMTAPRAYERWWPCIFLKDAYDLAKPFQRPFYCPALAWNGSRPWPVHISRVRYVETPGPIIEEIPEEEVEELPNGWTLLI
jgi:hypothetical protein